MNEAFFHTQKKTTAYTKSEHHVYKTSTNINTLYNVSLIFFYRILPKQLRCPKHTGRLKPRTNSEPTCENLYS